jgi:hypothetical protein
MIGFSSNMMQHASITSLTPAGGFCSALTSTTSFLQAGRQNAGGVKQGLPNEPLLPFHARQAPGPLLLKAVAQAAARLHTILVLLGLLAGPY